MLVGGGVKSDDVVAEVAWVKLTCMDVLDLVKLLLRNLQFLIECLNLF